MDEQDYDAGLLSDFGGGDVEWWQDYIRAELCRCNDYWRGVLYNHDTNSDIVSGFQGARK
jgi:hypothetical protein